MDFTTLNPFVPKATVTRYVNSIFELRLHLPGVVYNVDIVPHDNYVLVTGKITPRVRKDCEDRPSTVEWTDQPCGHFGRDVPVNLAPGTQLVVLECRQECDDYIVRFAIRNDHMNRSHGTCANIANRGQGYTRCACSATTVNRTQGCTFANHTQGCTCGGVLDRGYGHVGCSCGVTSYSTRNC